jgi:histidyl-tRNA synthetase
MISIPKGTKDVLPSESFKWQSLEKIAHEVCRLFNFKEIRTPVFEHTELFLRGMGDTTDVVNKEMYTFLDKGGRSITLKPEGTAGVARSIIENNLAEGGLPLKLYYFTQAYRYENPQKGRLREHHQFGVELFGSPLPDMDAEVIFAAHEFLTRVGVKKFSLRLNNIGCNTCRPAYNDALKQYFSKNISKMCGTCNDRLSKNPLRILDCKVPVCGEFTASAPVILDYVCGDCNSHFRELQVLLKNQGIEFSVDPKIVRGLDYYTKTVFEFVSENIGSQGTICGGGRYDNLIESLGGKPLPAAGFGLGIERLLLLLSAEGNEPYEANGLTIFVACAQSELFPFVSKLVSGFREGRLSAEYDLMKRSLKAQLKHADRLKAQYMIVVGNDEVGTGRYRLKDMRSGKEEIVTVEQILETLK